MATLTTSRRTALKPPLLEGEDLAQALRPWRRRVALLQAVRWLVRGIILGLCLACLTFLASRIVPWATAPYWAIGIGIVCPLITLCAALWYRPSIAHTTSIIDRQLHLHDRMRTAWELYEESGNGAGRDIESREKSLSFGMSQALVGLQRRDALKQLKQYTPVASLPLRFRRSTPILIVVVSIVLTLLIVLPNPMLDYLKQRADLQMQIGKQITSIEQQRHHIVQQANLPQSEKKRIDQILSDLEAKLQNAASKNEAQQAIADAEAKLNQLGDPQANNKSQAQKATGQSLQSSSNSTAQAIGQALANNDSKALQQALQDLANQASQLNNDQRSQLAQDVAKAANAASQNPALSSALQQLSKALADGSAGEIADATKAVEAAVNQTNNAQNSQNAVNNTSQSLQNAANNLAASTNGSNANSQSQQGQGQSGQQGQGQQGQNGQQGQGQGQGQSQGQGSQGQSQGGQGHGGSGGTNGAGNQQGNNEQVYVPGQIGQGNSQQTPDNNTGVVESGNQVSYQQVIEQYNQMAHDAIDNSNIAPDLKDLVYNYFNTLEGQQ